MTASIRFARAVGAVIELGLGDGFQAVGGDTDKCHDVLCDPACNGAKHILSRPAGALADKQIRPALVAICGEPDQLWTVDSLAGKACMLRSSFAERFNGLVGKSPMEFLTEWCMQLARCWLVQDHFKVVEVATRCGY